MSQSADQNNSLAKEREMLVQVQSESWVKRAKTYFKFLGPGFLQSAITLGGGTASACLLAGSKYGYKLLWVQPLAMILGVVVLAMVGKQVLSTGERPYLSFWTRLHPSLAILWAASAMLACIIWQIPQYSLGARSLTGMFGVIGLGNISPWYVGLLMLFASTYLVWNYDKGFKGIKVFETVLKVLVWSIVIIFAYVAFATGIKWDLVVDGLTKFYLPWDDPRGMRLVVGALSAAVGINMVFLYPYSLLRKKWDKIYTGVAQFDLIISMAVPFIFASTFIVIATANTLQSETRNAMDIVGVLSPMIGEKASALVLGTGLFAIAFSSITAISLAAGFIGCEMFKLPNEGKWYKIFSTVTVIGIIGSGYHLPFWAGVLASSTAIVLMPAALICFFILQNSKSFMGEAMPTGAKRFTWNFFILLAILIITAGGIISFLGKF